MDEARRKPVDAEKKKSLHRWLDRVQDLTPEFVRALVRPLYLNLFYHRMFPEYARQTRAERPALDNGLVAWSSYAPFLEFKRSLCRTLNMDARGLSCGGRSGLVSVVLPVYNGARYVAASIESVLSQTYGELELIVVDDGSTDATPAIVERFAARDPRMRVIRQPNRKLPAALNAGFREARGEYFTWTSADNVMRPGMLAALVGFLRENPDTEMVYGDEELIDESGAPARGTDFCKIYQDPVGSNVLRRPRDPGELNFIQNNFIGACFLYRAWAARAVGEYAEACFGFEDYDYWLRMNALFRFAHLGTPEVLYSYRLHPESLTAREKELRIAERTRYFLPVDEERRRFFAGSFDITLAGRHPWFGSLAAAYRQAGHNVFEMEEASAEALYRFRATRAFGKAVVIGSDAEGPGPGELRPLVWLEGARLRAGGWEWTAPGPGALEYALLAIANARLWQARAGG